jgi:hypothetical protein
MRRKWNCYSFSLTRLFQLGKYLTPCHLELTVDTPGFGLSNHPGLLSFEILTDAWLFALRRFVYDTKWTKEEVKTYILLLCINKATIEYFTRCCCNYLLLQDLNNRPGDYDSNVVAYVNKDYVGHPQLYQLPSPPSAWSLPYIPCRMFKNETFGGYVAENYRALTMLSPWIFRCLLDKEFTPSLPILPPHAKPWDRWTMKENATWLNVRGIKIAQKSLASERKTQVERYFNQPNGPPSVVPNITPSSSNIRHLLLLLFQIFGTLFFTNLNGEKAGNRFDALALQFLDCIKQIGRACLPNKKSPIWLSKYGMMGLLRCRFQHFVDYTYPHLLYEGGIEGDGMVKELRPLCPNAVRKGWPCNLMNAYNRQNILASLTSGFESYPMCSLPTDGQHTANGKRYSTWVDVEHAMKNHRPILIVVLGSVTS